MARLDIGEHHVKVTHVGLCYTKGGGEQVAACVVNEEGDGMTGYIGLAMSSEKAEEYAISALRAIGWDPIENEWQIEQLNEEGACVDTECRVTVIDEEYKGRMIRKIQYFNSLGFRAEKMSEQDAQAFGDRLRQRLQAGGGGRDQDDDRKWGKKKTGSRKKKASSKATKGNGDKGFDGF